MVRLDVLAVCTVAAVVVGNFGTVFKVEFDVLRVVFADVVGDTLGTVTKVDFDVFRAVVDDVGVVVVILGTVLTVEFDVLVEL